MNRAATPSPCFYQKVSGREGSDLGGADLSSATLHWSDLHGARLYSDKLFASELRNAAPGRTRQKRMNPPRPIPALEPSLLRGMEETRRLLADPEAYALGERAAMHVSDPTKLRRLFPQGFDFSTARQIFDAWLAELGDGYNEQEVNALWIGFAHWLCDRYLEHEAAGSCF